MTTEIINNKSKNVIDEVKAIFPNMSETEEAIVKNLAEEGCDRDTIIDRIYYGDSYSLQDYIDQINDEDDEDDYNDDDGEYYKD